MWLSTPSAESLTRPRIAVALVSAVAAASIGYYAYQNRLRTAPEAALPGSGLHRSNAVRRSRRRSRGHRHSDSSSSSELPPDENAENADHAETQDVPAAQPVGDGETVVEPANEEWWNDPSNYPPQQRAGHNIVSLLFRVSEDNAKRNGCVHRGCQCNSCGMVPIRGVRYRCANCADFDLCETCESQGVHIKTHIFYKIRIPAPPFGPRQMQPVWYTGDPDSCRRNLPRALITKLTRETGFERPELEAFWEQWTFMANTEWRDDPSELGIAMDRKTFERCLVPTGGSRHASPNLIHDRMFAFYDDNKDDLIGFSEFLRGLSYRKRKDKLRKVFDGYDLDGDGFVDRRDFLRMFRAYYVLYKQMHKDILDGLEDQLLASSEAQQLVASRQPLSSLFGREGRVPTADGPLAFSGKTLYPDGHVEIDVGMEDAVVPDTSDTADRDEILTNLFAYDTDPYSRRRMPPTDDVDTNWRTVRTLTSNDVDRAYFLALMHPPASLDELPGAIAGNNGLDDNATDETSEDDATEDREADDDHDNVDHPPAQRHDFTSVFRTTERIPTESEIRASYVNHYRQHGPRMTRRRQDLARRQLHERWKRRHFYLDEEEGGEPPSQWEEEEDILETSGIMGESSKRASPHLASVHSRSSSKARLAEDTSDIETQSDTSASFASQPERWAGLGIPVAEKDAGKEILYQVTQQAFNELLDIIFKQAEDLAVQAAATKEQRVKYKAEIDAVSLADDKTENGNGGQQEDVSVYAEKSPRHKTLEELLEESGYMLDSSHQEPRNAVEISIVEEIIREENALEAGEHSSNPAEGETTESESESLDEAEDEHRDPTLPQFRPNSIPAAPLPLPPSSSSKRKEKEPSKDGAKTDTEKPPASKKISSEPSIKTLRRWKKLNMAEQQAAERGGWGRLNFAEFEEIYKNQEHQGNRLDYLGSWIDFCIP
ncbi:hypothetical protein MKX07_002151 [Trichoderma sp. CBMAI-0711]|nr:hypothetical protein MKX07_002151 [Trichoderma sp. CBMAI-0711]